MRTARLDLRPWSDEDAPAFHRIWGDPRVVFWGPAADVAASLAMIQRTRARCAGRPAPVGWHALVERTTGELVGNVVLQPAPFAPGDLELGWHLRHDRWGHGYATEAAAAVAAQAFATLGVGHLVCAILPSNARSQAVARRLGFAVTAHDVPHGGLPHDVWTLPAPARSRPPGAAPRAPAAAPEDDARP
ncbi:MAG: GNAT family N-acetyltransferase [Planctomycetes bacterium]|nr:GNAT family N-acetyltransferase [Planctomycetota bacterium]